MNDSPTAPRAQTDAQVPGWLRLFGALLRPWLRIQRTPDDVHALLPDDPRPTVYVIERYGLSDTLILEQACKEAGLPSPYAAADRLPIKRRRAVVTLSRRPRVFGRPPHPTRSETLSLLADVVRADPEKDVRLVPVSIFVGRAPQRESGWFSVLFSENWVVVGRFRRLLALALNGRDTLVEFAAPVSLREAVAEESSAERGVRKLQRILRAHFRRVRAAVIGPDLSHRRTLIDGVVNAAPVQQAIENNASRDNIPLDKAAAKARAFAWEIAADQSPLVVRSASFLLSGLWEKIYRGVHMHHFDKLREIAPGHEVIFVPCHRSTTDDALLPYLLYRNGLAVPHIAAGVNLNLPLIGPLLRRGGAFFLRRSFSDPFYSTVFREYMSQLIARGISLMYFIEGGRSRTGRMLEARGGLLSMTLRSFLRQPDRPVVFQPVYIGYEKIMEGESYAGELSGKPKEKESWGGLIRSLGALRRNYGAVSVNFGEAVFLKPLLDEVAPDWKQATADPEAKPQWLKGAVDVLGERILVNINRAADVNPINLLGVALLATRKHAMSEADLLAQIELSKICSSRCRIPIASRSRLCRRRRSSPTARTCSGSAASRIRSATCSPSTKSPASCSVISATTSRICSRPRRGSRAASTTTARSGAPRSCASAASSIRSCRRNCSCRGARTNSSRACSRRSISSSRRACSKRAATAASSAAAPARATARSACARSPTTFCPRSSATTSRSPCS
jgi:glycerol-3-phosphate O-acyltransferase